jgi:AcrR family transcriptional regulator
MDEKVNPPSAKKRRYDASQRRAVAADTRESILSAARSLFIDRGYTATTMAAVANEAGVALDTIYATVGRKPQLFRLLMESAISGQQHPVPAEERGYVQAIRATADPSAKIRLYAHAVAEIQSRLAPLFRVLQEASRSEPALAELWSEISARRAANMRLFVADVAAGLPSLPNGLTVEEAADLVWATNGPEFYLLLVEERGWPLERFELRLSELWSNLLLP